MEATKLSIGVTRTFKERVEAICERTGLAITEYVRGAVADRIERDETHLRLEDQARSARQE